MLGVSILAEQTLEMISETYFIASSWFNIRWKGTCSRTFPIPTFILYFKPSTNYPRESRIRRLEKAPSIVSVRLKNCPKARVHRETISSRKKHGILIMLARFADAAPPRASGNANREQFRDVGGPSTLSSRG